MAQKSNRYGLDAAEFSVCLPMRLADGRCAEPIWAWYSYAKAAHDFVYAGVLARGGSVGPLVQRDPMMIEMLTVQAAAP